MRRNLQFGLCLFLAILVLGSFSKTYGETYKYTCKYAVELFSGVFKDGETLPPTYPDMWMINYPKNVYFAPDADKMVNRDFALDTLARLGSYRIIKKADDSIMFFDSKVQLLSETDWSYDVRSDLRFGRLIEKLDNFLYRDDKEIYPFSLQMVMESPVLFCFRTDSSTSEALFLFFSYTPHDNFPKSLLNEFSQEDGFEKLGFDPFLMTFPNPAKKPELIFKADAEYPDHLLRMKRSDNVKLMLLIDRDGTVVRVNVVKKAKYTQFDLAAVESAYKSFFKPGTDADGKPIPTWVDFEVIFDATEQIKLNKQPEG